MKIVIHPSVQMTVIPMRIQIQIQILSSMSLHPMGNPSSSIWHVVDPDTNTNPVLHNTSPKFHNMDTLPVSSFILANPSSSEESFYPLFKPDSSVPSVTGCSKCIHVYKELEVQSVHFWPNAVNA